MNKTISELLNIIECLVKSQASIDVIKNNISFTGDHTTALIKNLNDSIISFINNISNSFPSISEAYKSFKEWKSLYPLSNDAISNVKNDSINLKDTDAFIKLKKSLNDLYIKELTNNPENHEKELLNTFSGVSNFSYTAKIKAVPFTSDENNKEEIFTYGIVITADCVINTYSTDLDANNEAKKKLIYYWTQKIIRKFNVIDYSELLDKMLNLAASNSVKSICKSVELSDPMETNPDLTIDITECLATVQFMSSQIEKKIKMLNEKIALFPNTGSDAPSSR